MDHGASKDAKEIAFENSNQTKLRREARQCNTEKESAA